MYVRAVEQRLPIQTDRLQPPEKHSHRSRESRSCDGWAPCDCLWSYSLSPRTIQAYPAKKQARLLRGHGVTDLPDVPPRKRRADENAANGTGCKGARWTSQDPHIAQLVINHAIPLKPSFPFAEGP